MFKFVLFIHSFIYLLTYLCIINFQVVFTMFNHVFAKFTLSFPYPPPHLYRIGLLDMYTSPDKLERLRTPVRQAIFFSYMSCAKSENFSKIIYFRFYPFLMYKCTESDTSNPMIHRTDANYFKFLTAKLQRNIIFCCQFWPECHFAHLKLLQRI